MFFLGLGLFLIALCSLKPVTRWLQARADEATERARKLRLENDRMERERRGTY
ncbi:hypothetical protein [Gluconacetobacter tumulisoli]|uniref:Uncharacterized protein n=1 Tax=Gluconacetobacter tumulisoli TaxID=1286189 RepID=A0A7W4K7T8_9PROT|nr:hypothetical protein [Gluconacetobacter tumulisoli]MBB2201959.1 hypothetical protein [Gluconacetobacter tumulisoli]